MTSHQPFRFIPIQKGLHDVYIFHVNFSAYNLELSIDHDEQEGNHSFKEFDGEMKNEGSKRKERWKDGHFCIFRSAQELDFGMKGMKKEKESYANGTQTHTYLTFATILPSSLSLSLSLYLSLSLSLCIYGLL